MRVLVCCMVTLLSSCSGASVTSKSSALPAALARGLERVRAGTRTFHQLEAAAAAGYAANVPDCLVHEHHGAMGFHHVNPRYLDAKLELERPEILLYERKPDGRYQLNGVEFIVPYRAWPRDSLPPVLLGQQLKQEENLKIWYLHAWVWTVNADGVFADFNPAVKCDSATAKVFRPSQ